MSNRVPEGVGGQMGVPGIPGIPMETSSSQPVEVQSAMKKYNYQS